MNDKEEVEALVRSRSQATVSGDLKLLDKLLSIDFMYVNRWGDVVSRATYFKKKREKNPGSYWISQEIDEVRITTVSENVALATFRVLDHQMFEGTELKDYVRTSYICVCKNGNWQLAFGQTSPIEPDE